MKSMHQALHEDVLQEVKIEAENTMTSDDQVTLVDNDVIRKYINNVMDSVIEKKKQRKAINEEVQALYTEAESKGINRKALKAALSRYELSEEEREAMDFSYALCCNAKNIQFQSDLFDDRNDDSPLAA